MGKTQQQVSTPASWLSRFVFSLCIRGKSCILTAELPLSAIKKEDTCHGTPPFLRQDLPPDCSATLQTQDSSVRTRSEDPLVSERSTCPARVLRPRPAPQRPPPPIPLPRPLPQRSCPAGGLASGVFAPPQVPSPKPVPGPFPRGPCPFIPGISASFWSGGFHFPSVMKYRRGFQTHYEHMPITMPKQGRSPKKSHISKKNTEARKSRGPAQTKNLSRPWTEKGLSEKSKKRMPP